MNIEHLRLFVRVAATHNISQAGQELGLSAAVASNYLSKLEQDLGVRLLHRSTRKVALSEEGRAFLLHAEDVLASVEAALTSVGVGQSRPSGILRITAPASFGRMHLIPALPGFLQRYPDLHLDMRLTDTQVDLVGGGFDIAIRNSSLTDSTLVARALATDHRQLYAAPDYLARAGVPTHPQELLQHQCIHLIGLDSWSFSTEQGELTLKTQGRLRVDNGEAMRDACVAGLGIAQISRWNAYQHVQRGELLSILTEYPLISQAAIWALYPSSRQLAPKVRAFIDYFADYFGDPPYWSV